MQLAAGYHEIPMSDYLADCAPEPSLSTSTVEALYCGSPLRAWTYHPKLGKSPGEHSTRGDLGSAVHSLLLGGHAVAYGDFPDWRTKASQQFRDESRASNVLPVLTKYRDPIEKAVRNARAVLTELGSGTHEQTMLFQIEGVWCRARPDFLIDGLDVDVKTSDSADPHAWARMQSKGRNALQAGLRSLGHKALGQERKQVWLVVELEPPYDCSLVGMAPSFVAEQEEIVRWAAKLWRKCLDTNKWDGYPKKIHWMEAPAYGAQEFSDRTGVTP